MGIRRSGAIERFLQRLFVPTFVLSGMLVALGFYFPEFIGEEISGRSWLLISLVFFGSGLGYLSVVPAERETDPVERQGHYLLQVQRVGIAASIRRFLTHQDRVTFGVPLVALAGFFILQWLAEPALLSGVITIQGVLTEQLGWVFVGVMLLATLFSIFLLVSRWGDIRLGGPETTPAYTYPIYFTMFFTAGIAAGIVFSGMGDPIQLYGDPPPFYDVPAESDAAAAGALSYSLFHWGITAWSAYLVIGLPIAYFVYERGAPLRVSAILMPFLGPDGFDSVWAKLVDVLAIFATIGGIATSVALISEQFLIGIDFQWGVQLHLLGPILFVSGLTAIFVLSAQSGVRRGIRRIAVLNIVLFAIFALLIIAIGPRAEIVSYGAAGSGTYLRDFVPLSLQFGGEWVAAWTIWNWAWWFSWAPFAGLFLAALSRGRKIRTVVFTGVFATGLATIVWFLILGGTAIHLQETGAADILGAIATHEGSTAIAGFPLLEALPLSDLLIFLFLALIIVFITTSADTSTLIVAILGSKRDRAPSTAVIVFWGGIQGVVAITVLATGTGALLQGAAVLTGGPFALIALVAMVALGTGLRDLDRTGRSFPTVITDRLDGTRRWLQRDEDA